MRGQPGLSGLLVRLGAVPACLVSGARFSAGGWAWPEALARLRWRRGWIPTRCVLRHSAQNALIPLGPSPLTCGLLGGTPVSNSVPARENAVNRRDASRAARKARLCPCGARPRPCLGGKVTGVPQAKRVYTRTALRDDRGVQGPGPPCAGLSLGGGARRRQQLRTRVSVLLMRQRRFHRAAAVSAAGAACAWQRAV